MREIKFKVWEPHTKKFFYTDKKNWRHHLYGGSGDGILMEFQLPWQYKNNFKYSKENLSIDDLIWCQFTGLTDKNGVEIFEGDVVRHQGQFNLEVEFSEGVFHASTVIGHRLSLCEIIGNIYENPELLEGGE